MGLGLYNVKPYTITYRLYIQPTLRYNLSTFLTLSLCIEIETFFHM